MRFLVLSLFVCASIGVYSVYSFDAPPKEEKIVTDYPSVADEKQNRKYQKYKNLPKSKPMRF